MALPLLGLWLLVARPEFDLRWEDHPAHFWLVAGVAAVSLALAARINELADRAYFRNTVLVAAVNNVPAASYPAEFSSVFSVAACPGEGPFLLRYNPSPPVEFGAPGIGVSVPWAGGGTVTATGNSFAAAHVCGLAARILSKHPGLIPA